MSLVKGKASIPFKSNGSKERVTDPKQNNEEFEEPEARQFPYVSV
jgi:hypothetical protein